MNQKDTDKIVDSAFEGLEPFTITIREQYEAMFLGMALMTQMTQNREDGQEAIRLMIIRAREIGVEPAVKECFDEAAASGIEFPAFVRSVFVLLIGNFFKNTDKIREAIKEVRKSEQE